MTIRHLKIFITVADCGKMRQAAEQLYISQPSVSQAIQELERHYHVQLFDRLSQRIYLTESGKQLLSYARHVVSAFEEMDLQMKNAGMNRHLRIGGSITVGTCLLNRIISRLEERIPDIDSEVTVNNTASIENMLLRSELDVGIVEGVVKSPDLTAIPIYRDRLVLVAGTRHPLAQKESLTLTDLNGQIMISREEGSIERNQFEQMLIENHITMKTAWKCTNTETIKNAVENGRGLSIFSTMLIEKEVLAGTLKILPIENIQVYRDFQLIYHKDKFLSEPMSQFIEICRQMKNLEKA